MYIYTTTYRSNDSLNAFKLLNEIMCTGNEFHEAITRELKK